MSDTSQSLSHSRWHCTYHMVFVPKRRRQALFGNIRTALGPILHALAQQKACRILEGHVMSDHVHMYIEIPPKHAVASVISFLKGKSAIAIARQLCGWERNCTGEHFWARGYAVSTVGFERGHVGTPAPSPPVVPDADLDLPHAAHVWQAVQAWRFQV
jgi:putative transposase